MTTRVLLITQWFDPEPTFKGLVFARELKRLGYEVEVITGFPNYPGGKLYPGYTMRLRQTESIDGVKITRVPLYPSHDGSALKRIANYVSFATSALIYGLFFAQRPDVIYAYHPPLTVGITASLIRLFRRVPVVYDIQDMWPDTLRATGMVSNERVLKTVERVCNWLYRRVDRIVVLSPGFKRLLIERGVPEQKIDVIYNWCDESSLKSSVGNAPDIFPAGNFFKVVFAGNIGKAQALDSVLNAAEIVQKNVPSVRFVFVGDGVEVDRLKQFAKSKQLTNIVFIPKVPMSEVGAILQKADVLMVHLKNDPLFAITIPSKTQAYMSMGKPILMAVRGDAADVVEKAACGKLAQPEDAKSIAAAVKELAGMTSDDLQKMGVRAKEYYENNLSLRTGITQFGLIFDSLAKAPR
jgi:colanic acid biosynthesis glycosyl transferase WcaI